MEDQGFVYIMASGRNGTFYLGSAFDLAKRAWEHRNGVVEGSPRHMVANCWSGTRRIQASIQPGGAKIR